MTTDLPSPLIRAKTSPQQASRKPWCRAVAVVGCLLTIATGCDRPAAIETYTIPTKIPEQLQLGKERMLAAMIPKGEKAWFFKVSGPEGAIDQIETTFRGWVEAIEFSEQGDPDLRKLPDGWRMGANKNDAFRFASIDVDTATKQLDVSVSSLARQDDWDGQVKMNVNRWRGQLSLPASEDKWAEGKPIEVAAADPGGVWVDLIGEPGGSGAMMPPFAGSASSEVLGNRPMADVVSGGVAAAVPPEDGTATGGSSSSDGVDSRLKYDRPEGWRDGRMSSMRLAAFDVGPEGSTAELTVIPAGGDLRGNVARWLGQIWGKEVPSEVVDQAMADAREVKVDGRSAQRFFLTGEDRTKGDAIDATIVPLESGLSLFIKMTGPTETVSQQADAIASFLDSLRFNL